MNIVKEKTRLLFTDYTEPEKQFLENAVASMDNIFMYVDPDKDVLGLPTGMETSVKKMFPNAKFVDNSSSYWPFARIDPVSNDAQPRNQLQIDFINFLLENSNKQQKAAGILSTGTGKMNPLSEPIYTPSGWKQMGDIRIGDKIYSMNAAEAIVLGVYPQGVKNMYEVILEDGRSSRCGLEHLWTVKMKPHPSARTERITMTTESLMRIYHRIPCYIPVYKNGIKSSIIYMKVVGIEDLQQPEEAQCIYVDHPSHLYTTNDFILTHNTFMASYAATKVGLRTLIIAPTSAIKQQWADTLTGMFKVDESKVVVVKKPSDMINATADFVVVSHATLAILNKKYDLEKILKDDKFGIKVIDEVQMQFRNIINIDASANIANNWYITGTFGRSADEENKIYQEMFSDLAIFREKDKNPTIFNRKPGNVYGMKPYIQCKMIWAHSGLSKEEVKSVMTSIRYSEREGKWVRYGISVPKYMDLVIPKDGKMTRFLKVILDTVKLAQKECKYGTTLVLGSTISSAEIVAAYLRKQYPDLKIYTYHSQHTAQENAEAKEKADIMVSTTQSAGTGFDWKGLGKLVVFAQYKSWILCTQIAGRLRRRDDGKECYMYDIVDASVRQLANWANVRADVEKRKCKRFTVVDM